MLYITILLLIVLLLISYQDFRFQAVSWILFLAGFGLILFNSVSENTLLNLFINASGNTILVFFQLGIIYLYSRFKLKKQNIFKSVFGFGDLLFLIMIIPLFSPLNFIVFFLCSVIFSLIGYFLLKAFKIYKNERVPLAGLQSLFLIIVLISQFFIKFNLYNDYLILDKLNLF